VSNGRVVQENGLTDELISLALLGRTEDMVQAALYLEKQPGNEHHAITLYHKARRSALILCTFLTTAISTVLLI